MYVVFEGVDESGKSTQLALVKDQLEQIFKRNHDDVKVVEVSEPELDSVVDVDDDVELALRFALQRRLVQNSVSRQYFFHDNCNIVLSDRSFYSSLAYQGRNSVLLGWVRNLNMFSPEPTMVFFFDKGSPSSELLTPYHNYFKVLPFSCIYVDTKKFPTHVTTNYITSKIVTKWTKSFKHN